MIREQHFCAACMQFGACFCLSPRTGPDPIRSVESELLGSPNERGPRNSRCPKCGLRDAVTAREAANDFICDRCARDAAEDVE